MLEAWPTLRAPAPVWQLPSGHPLALRTHRATTATRSATGLCQLLCLLRSVADLMHFGMDPDPDLDPRNHASDKWIRIRILLFFLIDLQNANKKLP